MVEYKSGGLTKRKKKHKITHILYDNVYENEMW